MVLDASAVIELLLNTERGRRVSRRIAAPETLLHAPHLVDLEVAQCLRRYVSAQTISQERARLALEHLGALGLERYPHEPFIGRIWALRHNLTAYDAAYVALAETLAAPLLTCDQRLGQAPGLATTVEVVQ